MKTGKREIPPPNPYPKHTRRKISYRETQQKNPEKRTDRIAYLKSLRSKGKKKTQKACQKV